jgi:hypothetical protein
LTAITLQFRAEGSQSVVAAPETVMTALVAKLAGAACVFLVVAGAALALSSLACNTHPHGASGGVPLLISWDSPAEAAALDLTVSAPDLPGPLLVRIEANRSPVTIHVPPGADRTFAAHVVNALRFTTHAGALTVAVSAENMPALHIPLRAAHGRRELAVRVEPLDRLPSANPGLASH